MALPAEPVELLASEPGMVAAPKKTRKRIPLTEVAVLAALASAIPGLSDAVVRERTFCEDGVWCFVCPCKAATLTGPPDRSRALKIVHIQHLKKHVATRPHELCTLAS